MYSAGQERPATISSLVSLSTLTVRDKSLPENWKYIKLYEYFGTCTRREVTLSFKKIEKILGFPMPDGMKKNRTQWYARSGVHMMADAWELQDYRLKRLSFEDKRAVFEARYTDREKLSIPPEIYDRKLPAAAKFEIEHFFEYIIGKYGLAKEDLLPRK